MRHKPTQTHELLPFLSRFFGQHNLTNKKGIDNKCVCFLSLLLFAFRSTFKIITVPSLLKYCRADIFTSWTDIQRGGHRKYL